MPCACRVPVPDYPANAEWGPIFWNILHGLAEKSGQATLPADEIREWQAFLKTTGEVLPCDECRNHYRRYTQANPLTQFTQVPYTSLKTSVKTWLWQLHADIRTEYGKPVLPYYDLTATYGSVNLQDLFWRLEPVIKKTIVIKGMGLIKWLQWVNKFRMLRATLGV